MIPVSGGEARNRWQPIHHTVAAMFRLMFGVTMMVLSIAGVVSADPSRVLMALGFWKLIDLVTPAVDLLARFDAKFAGGSR